MQTNLRTSLEAPEDYRLQRSTARPAHNNLDPRSTRIQKKPIQSRPASARIVGGTEMSFTRGISSPLYPFQGRTVPLPSQSAARSIGRVAFAGPGT